MSLILYTDGGVLTVNPSPTGGSWAWAIVKNDTTVIDSDSGVIPAGFRGLQKITNNVSELYAAIQGLHAIAHHKEVEEWWTDSNVTRCRYVNPSPGWKGVPDSFRRAVLALRAKRNLKAVLCAGHATRREIKTGRRERNELPTSVWNTYVDEMCRRAAKEYLRWRMKKGK